MFIDGVVTAQPEQPTRSYLDLQLFWLMSVSMDNIKVKAKVPGRDKLGTVLLGPRSSARTYLCTYPSVKIHTYKPRVKHNA